MLNHYHYNPNVVVRIYSPNGSGYEQKLDLPFGNEKEQHDHRQLWGKEKRLNSQNLFVTEVKVNNTVLHRI